MVSIQHPDVENVSSHLAKCGYKLIFVTDDAVVLPLIDHSMDEDFRGMIEPVRAFYDAATRLTLQRLDPANREAFEKALSKERSDAVRGIVEYYSPPSALCEALSNTGFKIDEMRRVPNSPFINILAIKQRG